MIKKCFISIILLLAAGAVFAQTAREIETLLETPAVTYAQAARFILEASSAQTAFNNQQAAFRYAHERGWFQPSLSSDETARLDHISKLLMNAFDIKGGLMYSITNSPHHAYRELSHKNIIQGRATGSQKVSGEYLLFITGRILEYQEEVERNRPVREREARQVRDRERRETVAAEITVKLAERAVPNTTVEVTDTGVTIIVFHHFLADSAVLYAPERARLREVADVLREIPDLKIQVHGHTALSGTEENRASISRERAEAVANYLISVGAVEARNVTAMGFGATRPIADNSTEEGRARNRRLEIIILEN